MSVETSRVEHLGRELGQAIAELDEYEAYEQARKAVQDDDETQEKIDEFEALRHEFMLARQAGQATQDDIIELQRTQRELHQLPVMERFLDAQTELDVRLAAINDAISDELSLNFSDQAGGCCHD